MLQSIGAIARIGVTLGATVGVALLWRGTLSGEPALRCSMASAPSLLLITIEKDTIVSHGVGSERPRQGGWPRVKYADANSPMPAARVHVLDADSATRRVIGDPADVSDAPVYIRASPYAPDCLTIEWTDTVPWVVPGDTGFARALLLPRERWINERPVFVISNHWDYPYPRSRGVLRVALPGRPEPDAISSAHQLFSFMAAIDAPGIPTSNPQRDSIRARTRGALGAAEHRSCRSRANTHVAHATRARALLSPRWRALFDVHSWRQRRRSTSGGAS